MRIVVDEDEHQPLKKAKRLKPKGLAKRIHALDAESHDEAMERLCDCLVFTHPSRTSQDS